MIAKTSKLNIAKSLRNWRALTPDRLKLQHVYLAVGVASVILAGLIGLINYSTGQRLVSFGLLSLGMYVINAIVWALVDGLLLIRIDRQNTVSPTLVAKPSKKVLPKTTSIKK